MSKTDRLWVAVGFPTLGLVLALALPPLARWAFDWHTGLPARPVFWVVGWPDQPWKVAVSVAPAVLAGAAIARTALRDTATVTVTDQRVHVKVGDQERDIARSAVAAAFLDAKLLVLLDQESRYLLRQLLECPAAATERALRGHGYPWHDADPYAALFRQWDPNSSELPSELHAVLEAREAALKKRAEREVAQLSDVIGKFGFVVREDGTRQFWRPLVRS